jgi:hypothetical protein
MSTHPHVDMNEQYGSNNYDFIEMGLDLGNRKLDKSDKINNNYSNTDFADKYIKKKNSS